jgi:hypothetical protein
VLFTGVDDQHQRRERIVRSKPAGRIGQIRLHGGCMKQKPGAPAGLIA